MATTKWAIEYEHPASEAFKLNHPETEVFCENCNVILRFVRHSCKIWSSIRTPLVLGVLVSSLDVFVHHRKMLQIHLSPGFMNRCIMEKGGDSEDCLSTPEAQEMASVLPEEKKRLLPKQGEVDFINGGPPCQVLHAPALSNWYWVIVARL